MNNEEAKNILSSYRPNGRDGSDPLFAGPLDQIERDPELGAWFERERKFDTVVAGKLLEIMPPAGFRAAIIAANRASPPKRPWWRNPLWLAAAAVVMLFVVTLSFKRTALQSADDFAGFALSDLARASQEHEQHPERLADIQAQLAGENLPLTRNLKLDLAHLRKLRCRAIRSGGREVFEVCFQRDGTVFHVYVARRSDFAPAPLDGITPVSTQGQLAATVWSDSEYIYALATAAGAETLRRII